MTDRLAGCVAIVTGSGGGQGAAHARKVVAEGGRVLVADVDDGAGEALAAELGDRAAYHHLDVRSEDDWRAALATAVAAFGSVNALVNNAGIVSPPRSILKTPVADYRNVIEVNQIGAYTGIHVIAPAIIEAGGGSIVNISSVNGFVGAWGIAGYVSSKFALRGLTRTAAIELARKGVRVNSIHPGPIDTPMLRQGLPEGMDAAAVMGRTVPAGRVGTVDDVAAMVAFLLSDESSYCYGAEFVVDGGFLAGPMGAPG
ncbi:MAG: 3-alpha-hydroxysteroid dehydrogenase [Actinomycetia bacterium]|nr:3-alpha-hydroxysteroid dehydrogenase [Actinomycetes bacterium]